MTKNELIKEMVAVTNVNYEQTSKVVECFMDCIKKSIANGENVYLRGFGTFQNVLRHEKKFHYAPGKFRMIPEHYEVKLKFSKEVINMVKIVENE